MKLVGKQSMKTRGSYSEKSLDRTTYEETKTLLGNQVKEAFRRLKGTLDYAEDEGDWDKGREDERNM